MIAEICIFSFVAFITSLFFTYKNRVDYFNSFKKRNIPGPPPNLLLGNYREIKKHKNKNDVIEKWLKQYGEKSKCFGYYVGQKRYIVLNDLDTINQVFIKNVKAFYNREDFALDAKYLIDSVLALKNERWAYVRRILTPVFSYTKVHSGTFDPEIKASIMELNNEIIKRIRESKMVDLNGQKSAEFDIHNITQAFTLDVISRTSFGLEEKVYEPDNHLMRIVKEYFQFAGNIFVELAMLVPVLKAILTYINNNLSSGRLIDMMTVKLKEHINVFLKQFQNNSKSTNDEDDELEVKDQKGKYSQQKAKVLVSLIKKLADKSITEHEFIGNILLILLAGYETTANTVTNAIYLLAKHQDIQAKLREEVRKDGLESKYLDMFWHENLRFFPPVTLFVTRKAGEDCVINGTQFLKDDIAQAPVWLIHRNDNIWRDANKFIPERWSPEERKTFHPCQFLTYGLGQKACLGLNFANYEGKLLMINLLKEFQIDATKDTPDPLKFITPTVINNPSTPVVIKFTKIDE